jgi:seryl-tRNA synthetase
MIDFERGAKVSGSKFYFLTDDDAWAEWKLITEMIEYHRTNGWTFVIPPYLVNRQIAEFAGIIPRFETEYYTIPDDGMICIPTAEIPLVGMHSNELFKKSDLPIKYCAFSPCFRREAGSHGTKTKGLKRVHQFHKVELFVICDQDSSDLIHQQMVAYVEGMIRDLYPNLIYRTILLPDWDKSPISNKTYDIELQYGDEWLEVSSISNMGDNQSKLAQIRYKDINGKNKKCHLLNGSALALPRLRLALQQYGQG